MWREYRRCFAPRIAQSIEELPLPVDWRLCHYQQLDAYVRGFIGHIETVNELLVLFRVSQLLIVEGICFLSLAP